MIRAIQLDITSSSRVASRARTGAAKLLGSMDRVPQCYASANRDVFAVRVMCRRTRCGVGGGHRGVRGGDVDRLAPADVHDEVDGCHRLDGRQQARRSGAPAAAA